MITGTFISTANFAADTLFLICTYHLCAKLRILHEDLTDLGDVRGDPALEIINLIRRHQIEIE